MEQAGMDIFWSPDFLDAKKSSRLKDFVEILQKQG